MKLSTKTYDFNHQTVYYWSVKLPLTFNLGIFMKKAFSEKDSELINFLQEGKTFRQIAELTSRNEHTLRSRISQLQSEGRVREDYSLNLDKEQKKRDIGVLLLKKRWNQLSSEKLGQITFKFNLEDYADINWYEKEDLENILRVAITYLRNPFNKKYLHKLNVDEIIFLKDIVSWGYTMKLDPALGQEWFDLTGDLDINYDVTFN